jgi:hypothetical protein
LNVALDVAEVGLTGSPVVDALKIPADFDAGADKPARLRALLNLDATTHRHPAFEKRGCALIGQDIAVDRRRLLRRVDGETRILQNLHIPRDGCVGQRTGRAARHDNVAGDAPTQGAGAARVSSVNHRGAPYERRNGHQYSVCEPLQAFLLLVRVVVMLRC